MERIRGILANEAVATLIDEDMQRIRQLDLGHSLFFSHYDPQTVKWLCDYGKSK